MSGTAGPRGPGDAHDASPAGLVRMVCEDAGEATTQDWALDPEAWCGWPYIHGPHGGPDDPGDPARGSNSDGRLCSGVLWATLPGEET